VWRLNRRAPFGGEARLEQHARAGEGELEIGSRQVRGEQHAQCQNLLGGSAHRRRQSAWPRLHDLLDVGEQRREARLPRRRDADRFAERLLRCDAAGHRCGLRRCLRLARGSDRWRIAHSRRFGGLRPDRSLRGGRGPNDDRLADRLLAGEAWCDIAG